MLQSVTACEYYLSSIYPVANLRDNGPRIGIEKSAGVITTQAGSINTIDDVLFKSRGQRAESREQRAEGREQV